MKNEKFEIKFKEKLKCFNNYKEKMVKPFFIL